MQKVTVDLTENKKQYDFFLEVVKACNGLTGKRKFAYGGAIRGGKTYVILFILVYLCNKYHGSKWVVIRESFPSLQKTTIESLKKLLNYSLEWSWTLDKGNYFVENKHGSRIYFMAENIDRDKDLNAFLGLEVNGVFFEQLEELSQKLWEIAGSRAGSWYIDNMPPAFIFTTFNPTQRWPKQFLYERHRDNTLPDDFLYQTALPSDNAFITKDQWNHWGAMADRYQKQFIGGDWTDFDDTDPRWLFTFNEQKHVSKVPLLLIPEMPVHLAIDFNINPITCIAGQHTSTYGEGAFVRIMKEFELPDSAIKELTTQVKATYAFSVLTATGDATGRNRNAGYTSGDETLWSMVQAQLQLSDGQILTPLDNPSHKNSRFLCNTLMQSHPNYLIDPSCTKLIDECKKAKPKPTKRPEDEDKLLKGPGDSDIGMNLFDCFRYYNNTHFSDFAQYV
jgi:hypothetical protein